MKKSMILMLCAALLVTSHAEEPDGWEMFEWLEALKGVWVLSEPSKQVGTESYRHPALEGLAGSNTPGVVYKLIGAETVVEEDLLPDTPKQMVTMYHCKDIACSTLKATHYCVKQNQPEFIANKTLSSPTRIVFDCDMSTEWCQSDEDHVHQIVLELSENGNHLKSSYLSWKDHKPTPVSSIYHFNRRP